MLNGFFERVVLGNSLEAYLKAATAIAVGIFVLWVIKIVVLRRLNAWAARTSTNIDDFIVNAIEKYLLPLIYFGVVYLGINGLALNPAVAKGLNALAAVLITFLGILFLNSFIRYAVFEVYLKQQADSALLATRFQTLMPAMSVLIWVIGCIFLLDNLGFKISAIVAGLGIGGVAVALAASTVLADLFAYLVIMFDRPFVIGDFIILGDYMGAVEHIGIKTTRIRSLGGELLVFSNKDLTDSRIRNYKIMERRRIVFSFGVTYQTPSDVLEQIPQLVKTIIEKQPDATFDRAHFLSFADSSLTFEVVYYVLSADYNKYMDRQQAINFTIKREFEARGIDFAYPTQSLYLHRA